MESKKILDVINQYGLTKDSLEEMIERDNQHKKIMLKYYEVESKNRFGHIGNSINNILKTNDKFREIHLNPFTEKQPTKEEGFEPTGVAKFYSTFGRLPNKSERVFITEYGVNAIIDLIHSVTIGYEKGILAQVLSEYTEIVMSQKSNKTV